MYEIDEYLGLFWLESTGLPHVTAAEKHEETHAAMAMAQSSGDGPKQPFA